MLGMDLWFEYLLKALIILLCGVAALLANRPIRYALRKIEPPAPKGESLVLDPHKTLPGGRWIGLLERAGVYGCLVAGFPAGIAFIVAIKGLGRYPELRAQANPRVGELFIIGTLASLLWAAAFAGLAYWGVRAW